MRSGLERRHADASSRPSAQDKSVASSAREINRAVVDTVVDVDEARKAERQRRFDATQLQAILNVLPAYTWYAAPSGALTFVNKRTGDYLGVPDDHPLCFGIDVGAQWDDWVPLLHPDDREEARKYCSTCLRTGAPAEHSYRVRNAQGTTAGSSRAPPRFECSG